MGTNIKALAQLALTYMERIPKKGTPPPGEAMPLYWDFKDNAPDWFKLVCQAAHEKMDMLPNDQRFEYIHASLERMATTPEGFTSMEYRVKVGGIPDLWEGQEDITYSDLADWWTSNEWRNQYATDAIASGKKHNTITDILQHAQRIEMSRTFGQLLTELHRLCSGSTLGY